MKERYSFKKGFNCLQNPFVIKANRKEYLTIINAVISIIISAFVIAGLIYGIMEAKERFLTEHKYIWAIIAGTALAVGLLAAGGIFTSFIRFGSLFIATVGDTIAQVVLYLLIPGTVWGLLFYRCIMVFINRNEEMHFWELIFVSGMCSSFVSAFVVYAMHKLYTGHEEHYRKNTEPYITFHKTIIGDGDETTLQKALQSLTNLVAEINYKKMGHLLFDITISAQLRSQYEYLLLMATSDICCKYRIRYTDLSTPLHPHGGLKEVESSCATKEESSIEDKPIKIELVLSGEHEKEGKGVSIAKVAGDNVELYKKLLKEGSELFDKDEILEGFEQRHRLYIRLYDAFKGANYSTEETISDQKYYESAVGSLGYSNSIRQHYYDNKGGSQSV